MFNYSLQYEILIHHSTKTPKKVEQYCYNCHSWFQVASDHILAALKEWRNGASFHHVTMCKCLTCNAEQILVMPGKYDKVHAKSRDACSVQFWQW